MEPKARIKSGLIAVALGLTTTFSSVGGPFSFWGLSDDHSVMAQAPVGSIAPPMTQPAAQPMMPSNYVQPVLRSAPPLTLEQAVQISTDKLFEARKAVAVKDLALAHRLVEEARAMQIPYREGDARPEVVQQLIQHSQAMGEQRKTAGSSDPFRRNYALFLMHQAGGLLQYGETDLATQLTHEAQAQNVVYNHADIQAGLEPTAMFRRIDDVKRIKGMNTPLTAAPAHPQHQAALSTATQRDLNQAISFLNQARQSLSAGQIDRAEQLCRHAENLKLSETIYPAPSETPSRLLAEIAAMRQRMPQPAAPAPMIAAPQQAAQQAVYHPAQDQTQNVPVRAGESHQAPLVAMNPMQPSGNPVVDQARQQQEMILQQVATSIMQQISDAQRMSRDQRNPEAGLEILQKARQNVEQSQLDAATKASFIRNIDKAIEETDQYTKRYENQFNLEQANQAVWAERQLAQEQFRHREDQLKTYVMECNKLIDDQRYDEAVIIAKKAKELAPDEPAAQMLLTTTQLAWNVHRSMSIRDRKAEEVANAFLGVDEASVPMDFDRQSVYFPRNWNDMRRRSRKTTEQITMGRRPETELEIIRRLEMPVSLNIGHPLPVGQIFQLLQGQTGVNFFIDWPALAEVDVTSDKLVKINVMNEIKLKSVLNLILEQLNLAYVVRNEMLNITSATKAKGQLYAEYYYVGDLIMGITNSDGRHQNDFNSAMDRAMLHSVAATSGQRGGLYANHGGVQIDPNLAAQTGNPNILAQLNGGSGMGTTFGSGGGGNGFGVPGAAGAGGGGSADFGPIMDLIEAVVAPDSWASNGGEGEMTEYLPNLSLVVRQTEEVHAELVELLSQLRKLNDLQIAVEVRYITLADDFYEKMGIDFNMNFKNDGATDKITTMLSSGSNSNSNSNSSSSSSSSNSNSDSDSSYSTMTITGGNNVTVGLTGPGTTAFSVDLALPFAQNNYGLAVPQYGGYQADAGTSFGFALLSNIEAYFFMSATQGDTRSNLLQAPKVTIFNGQMGVVSDVTQVPFVTSVIPVVGDFAAAYQPIIVILNEGQFMSVQGVVSSNRQFVRLTLNPVFSTITKVNTFRYVGEDNLTDTTEASSKGDEKNATSGDERASKRTQTASTSGVTIQLPSLATFNVITTVSVPDGGTILLGGIKRLKEGRVEAGTPILNKIPYINRLFMNTAIGRETQSIMMMVTPRIIIQEEEEEYLTGVPVAP